MARFWKGNGAIPSDYVVEHCQAQFDLLLLDIEMPFINGMDASRYIRRMDQRVIIIFISSLAQYAIQGYEVMPWTTPYGNHQNNQ